MPTQKWIEGARGQDAWAQLVLQPDTSIDVAEGAALIAADFLPGTRFEKVRADLDALAEPLVKKNLASCELEAQATALSTHLFHVLRFRGNEDDYYDPRNSLLPSVLESRQGIPLTLAIVFVEVAKRLGVHASGVTFPGHYLVRVEKGESDFPSPIFIDAFSGGKMLEEEDLDHLLRRALGPTAIRLPEHTKKANARATLVRLLTNLKSAYLGRGDFARAELSLHRIVDLVPHSLLALRERALLSKKLGALDSAARDLERILQIDPYAADAEDLKREIGMLTQKRTLH